MDTLNRVAASRQDGLSADRVQPVRLYCGRVEVVSIFRQPARRSSAGGSDPVLLRAHQTAYRAAAGSAEVRSEGGIAPVKRRKGSKISSTVLCILIHFPTLISLTASSICLLYYPLYLSVHVCMTMAVPLSVFYL